jgi:hypothetical protein
MEDRSAERKYYLMIAMLLLAVQEILSILKDTFLVKIK